MLERKNLLLLLSIAGIVIGSTASYASSVRPMKDEVMSLSPTIPNLRPGFEFDIAALALRPAASNLNYVINNKELPVQSPTWTETELDPSYAAAFELGIRYILRNQNGNDINLDWTHLNSNTSSTLAADGFTYFLGPDYEIGPAGLPIRNAAGSVNFKYDVVNLDFGQYLDFGKHVEIRFFGGLSAAGLREEVKATYTGNVLTGLYPGPFSTTSDFNSNFTGAGPRFGMQMTYAADNGFGILGEAGVSALIGASHSKLNYMSSAVQLQTVYGQSINNQYVADQTNTQVVPGIDAKLGFQYKRALNNGALLTLQLGYQAAVYMNAINQYMPGTLVAGQALETGGIFVATMSHTQSNYNVQGPFLKLGLQC